MYKIACYFYDIEIVAHLSKLTVGKKTCDSLDII